MKQEGFYLNLDIILILPPLKSSGPSSTFEREGTPLSNQESPPSLSSLLLELCSAKYSVLALFSLLPLLSPTSLWLTETSLAVSSAT